MAARNGFAAIPECARLIVGSRSNCAMASITDMDIQPVALVGFMPPGARQWDVNTHVHQFRDVGRHLDHIIP